MAKNSSDSTIKFLIYVLLFLIFILLMLLLFIIPSIKHYKSKRADLYSYTSQNKHLSQKQVALDGAIKQHRETHKETIEAFSKEFNKTDFMRFAGNYFTNVTLEESNHTKQGSQFQEYVFSATTQANTPVDFYKFIDDLSSYDTIIKINFPITLITGNENINLDFNMSVFKENN